MKPYGREKKITGGQPWKKDYHPRKGERNWWEDMCDFLSRSTIKQRSKKEIENEINDKMATTKENIRTKVIDMLDDHRKTMEEKLDALLDSGHIDFDNTEDNYRLPKLIVCALARETEHQFSPPNKTRMDDREIEMLHIRMNIPKF